MLDDRTITQLLQDAERGDQVAFRELYSLLYEELRRLARTVRGGGHHTLNTTSLVHEAYLKVVPGSVIPVRDRIHFFRIAARAMRQVLIDAARRRRTREQGKQQLFLEADASVPDLVSAELLDLEEALNELEELSPRQAQVVECRYFAGLSQEETAVALGVSVPTVKRDWRVARAWLAQALGSAEGARGRGGHA